MTVRRAAADRLEAVGNGRFVFRECFFKSESTRVFLSDDRQTEQRVTVKIATQATEELRRQFAAEADALRQLKHPHILQLITHGEESGLPFVVLEYLTPRSLRQRMPEGGAAPPRTIEEMLYWLGPIASALDYAHSRGFVHGDIRPENIHLSEQDRVCLAELACPTQDPTHHRTLAYMAPEQVRGESETPETDRYALGLMVYEWLAGHRPFLEGDAREALAGRQRGPEPLSTHRPELALLDGVLASALAYEPSRRFANCRAFVIALNQAHRKSDPLPPRIPLDPTSAVWGHATIPNDLQPPHQAVRPPGTGDFQQPQEAGLADQWRQSPDKPPPARVAGWKLAFGALLLALVSFVVGAKVGGVGLFAKKTDEEGPSPPVTIAAVPEKPRATADGNPELQRIRSRNAELESENQKLRENTATAGVKSTDILKLTQERNTALQERDDLNRDLTSTRKQLTQEEAKVARLTKDMSEAQLKAAEARKSEKEALAQGKTDRVNAQKEYDVLKARTSQLQAKADNLGKEREMLFEQVGKEKDLRDRTLQALTGTVVCVLLANHAKADIMYQVRDIAVDGNSAAWKSEKIKAGGAILIRGGGAYTVGLELKFDPTNKNNPAKMVTKRLTVERWPEKITPGYDQVRLYYTFLNCPEIPNCVTLEEQDTEKKEKAAPVKKTR